MTQSQPTSPAPAPKTSGHAIAGLLVGLGGLCTCGVGGIVGLVLSIVALKKIDASRGTLGGRGLAIAGIIASAVCILVGLVIGLGVLVAFIAAARCESHHARPESADPPWSTPAPSPGSFLRPCVPERGDSAAGILACRAVAKNGHRASAYLRSPRRPARVEGRS